MPLGLAAVTEQCCRQASRAGVAMVCQRYDETAKSKPYNCLNHILRTMSIAPKHNAAARYRAQSAALIPNTGLGANSDHRYRVQSPMPITHTGLRASTGHRYRAQS